MQKPQFSVIIPTLNEEKFLPSLLESLTVQTKKNFEVIVVDGSSKDKTVNVAKRFAKKLPSLRVIVSKKASLPLQRNTGARAAHADWFVFADADGAFLPYFIERCQRFIVEYKPTVFTTWFYADSDKTSDALSILLGNMLIEGSILVKRQLPPGPLSIMSRTAFGAVGGYDEGHAFNEDWDIGLRLDKAGFKLSMLRETLCSYSLRRFRRQGTLKVLQAYTKATAVALFTKRAASSMGGYIMGGHLYDRKRSIKRSMLKVYDRKLRKFVKEFFS